MKTYHADVERGTKFWIIYVPEVDRHTQARHLREAEAMARDLIAIMDDVPADSFELDMHVKLPASVARHLDRAAQLRAKAAEAQHQAAAEQRAAARELAEQGLPMRDIGRALGISYQRAHQLVSAA